MRQLVAIASFVALVVTLAGTETFAQPNEISYEISAVLDAEKKMISGSQTIQLTNRTGQILNELYLYLHPNRFKPGSLVALYEDYEDFDLFFPHGPRWGWLNVTELKVNGIESDFLVDDILMSVDLLSPLGDSEAVTLELEFEMQIPESHRRLGYNKTNFYIQWWYPQLAVHDGTQWYHDPIVGYSSAETFQDFATYDVRLYVPEEFVVGATGNLVSEGEMDGIKELRYEATNVHDFAWVADSTFQRDVIACGEITIFSLYQPKYSEAARAMAQTSCEALEYFSNRFGLYPYEQFTIAQTGLGFGAMEYPQLIMNGDIFYRIPPHIRFGQMVTAHEVAHQWFYGLLMSNQVAETWLDEGFAEFGTIAFMEETYGVEENLFDKEAIASFASELLVDPYIGVWSGIIGADSVRDMTFDEYVSIAKRGVEAPVLTHRADVALGKTYLPYQKGAIALLALEEYLGRETFNEVVQTYFGRHVYGHPTSADFIAIAEEVSGEGLGWFFDAWLRGTEKIDFAVTAIDREELRTTIRLKNNELLRMPVDVEIQFRGDAEPIVERWEHISETGEIVYEGDLQVKNVKIDPDRDYPDINRLNNRIYNPIEFEPYFTHGMLQGYPDDGFLVGPTIAVVGKDMNLTAFYIVNRKKIGWDVSGSQKFMFTGRRDSEVRAHIRDDSHIMKAEAELELKWFIPITFNLRSTHALSVSTFSFDRYDVDEDPGHSLGAHFNYHLLLRDQRATFINLYLNHTRSLPNSEFTFEKFSADLQINQRVAWMTYLNGRIFAGKKLGAEPVDGDFNLGQHGLFRTFERQSDMLFAGNVDLRFPLPGLNYLDLGFFPLPLSAAGILFADGAMFPSENDDVRAAAGVGILIGAFGNRDMLRIEYPLWVNTPEDEGKREIKFRMNVAF